MKNIRILSFHTYDTIVWTTKRRDTMGYVEELRKIVGHRPLILVGAVVLVINENRYVLLQQRTEPYGKWGLPGGLMELSESPEETAFREVYEKQE